MQAENKKNTNKSQDIWSEQIYRQWQDLQRQYASNSWKLIEYSDNSWQQDSWHILLDSDHEGIIPFSLVQFKGDVIDEQLDIYNRVLVNLFVKKTKPKNKFWDTYDEWTSLDGVVVPQSALIKLGLPNLNESLDHIQFFSQQYPFHQVLKEIQELTTEGNSAKLYTYQSLWIIIESYTNFFAKLEDDKSKEAVISYLSIIWNQSSTNELLPSTQLAHALIHLIIDIARPTSLSSKFKSDQYGNDVSEFLKINELELRIILTKKLESTTLEKEEETILENIKQSFYSICASELSLITIQEYLNNPNNRELWDPLPQQIKQAFRQIKPNSMMDRIQSAVHKKSIIDRIKSFASSEEQTHLPYYYTTADIEKSEANTFWHQLTNDSIIEISDYFREIQTAITENTLKEKRNRHIKKIFNKLTMPVLEWRVIASTLVPLWNTTQHEELETVINDYKKARELELEEAKLFFGIKKDLIGLTKESQLDKYLLTVNPFKSPIFTGRFNKLIKSERLNIRNKRHFSIKKMEEYGITEDLEPQHKNRELYLEELLNIEKAVRPYILYVKKAFDSALPENRENFFDPYRHSIDGIEFDPETVQNVDKWLKGEVMKTINIKEQIHEALQINCFAMDSSGSMDHNKMRNLFKLIYLIVTGLSGKATYDSFHFFGTHFIPAAEFNHSFDSKNLLYKILKKITHITTNGTIRYGGVGGTFLSGAITECHQRITKFAKPFNNKEINYFKTLFVITDGEPSIGVIDPSNLAELIKQKRKDGDVTIKGIYVGPSSKTPTMPIIFGKDQYVETANFSTAIVELIDTMSKTYKEQRTRLKMAKSKQRNYD